MSASFSSPKELSTIGILFHPTLWNLLLSTRLRIDWTTTSLEMDAYKAQLFKSIIYKYKYLLTYSEMVWIWIWIVSQQGPKLGYHTDGVHDYGAA